MSLELAKRLAARVAPGATDRLRFVQLPLNPTMPEALTTASQTVGGHELPALAACRSLGVHAIASRSVAKGEIRLPPKVVRTLGESLKSDAQRSLQFARSAPAVISALAGMKSPNFCRREPRSLCCRSPVPGDVREPSGLRLNVRFAAGARQSDHAADSASRTRGRGCSLLHRHAWRHATEPSIVLMSISSISIRWRLLAVHFLDTLWLA